jgi:hypothetical protein
MDKPIQQKRCSPFNYAKQSEDTRCIKQTSHILLYAVISFVFKLLLLTLLVSNCIKVDDYIYCREQYPIDRTDRERQVERNMNVISYFENGKS